MNQDLSVFLDDLNEDSDISPDAKLHRLLQFMNPYILPSWKGLELTGDSLKKLAEQSLKGDEKSYSKIEEILENKLTVITSEIIAPTENDKKENFINILTKKIDKFDYAWSLLVNFGLERHLKPKRNIIIPSLILFS